MHQVFKLSFQQNKWEENQVGSISIFIHIFSFLDTYISMVSYSHLICAKGIFVAIISAQVETDKPEEEIQPAISLLGDVLEMFVSVSDTYEPVADGKDSNLWITKSYDATSHFEEASEEILDIY